MLVSCSRGDVLVHGRAGSLIPVCVPTHIRTVTGATHHTLLHVHRYRDESLPNDHQPTKRPLCRPRCGTRTLAPMTHMTWSASIRHFSMKIGPSEFPMRTQTRPLLSERGGKSSKLKQRAFDTLCVTSLKTPTARRAARRSAADSRAEREASVDQRASSRNSATW